MKLSYVITLPVIVEMTDLGHVLVDALDTPGTHDIATVEPVAGHSGATIVRWPDKQFTVESRGEGDEAIVDAVTGALDELGILVK